MASFQVGFYAIIILLTCKVILIILEVLFNNTRKPNARFLVVFGYVSAFLALLLGCVSFVGLRAKGPDEPGQCENADADIVGDGVRAAAWTQVGILFFITLTGIFHYYKTAVKEIGGGLIITHVSLAIALLVPLARRELSPIDAILGSLILDAQGNSLSIQLVTKETLAARWQVAIVLIAQLLGLIIEGILVGNFITNLRPTRDCDCFSAFWWAWLSNCPSASPNEIEPFWIYFGYRFINIIHGGYFAITRTGIYDDAEKWDRENPCDPCDKCREGTPRSLSCQCHLCEKCRYCKVCKRRERCHQHQPIVPIQNDSFNAIILRNGDICRDCYRCEKCGHSDLDAGYSVLLAGERYSENSVTVSINFLESSVLALLSMVSAEVTMNINMVQKTSPLYAVGQVTALVIAGGTAARALWVFLYMFDGRATHSAY
ncbi:hypothetical protein F5Y00DRAFT_249779 [Daldinia vernicosa]|uniref:uncharacterized protein n=1 Tax=Daldinia vernicosa TaxID=114800 RepID=UPI002008980F|nr:uncharacterized protein F5Y00DRAFT_249779 [Daldinia vernicosa]KAI0843999.1 hypothetical protein F5Y00DRAFT_249779 [Daldinia vernicosa]